MKNHQIYDIEYDEEISRKLVKLRGGCSCHIMPPCSNCCEPMKIYEAEELGLIEENYDEEKE